MTGWVCARCWQFHLWVDISNLIATCGWIYPQGMKSSATQLWVSYNVDIMTEIKTTHTHPQNGEHALNIRVATFFSDSVDFIMTPDFLSLGMTFAPHESIPLVTLPEHIHTSWKNYTAMKQIDPDHAHVRFSMWTDDAPEYHHQRVITFGDGFIQTELKQALHEIHEAFTTGVTDTW